MKMKITESNGKINIETPYNPAFVAKLKDLGARWNPTGKVWTADANTIDFVRQAMLQVYGETDIPDTGNKVNIKVTAINKLYEDLGSIVLFGRIIASATGRDSGAKPGNKVSFPNGGLASGGSANNWRTIIDAGTEFYVYEVPETLISNSSDYTVEIIPTENNINKSALLEEKEKLLARLAEIEKLINE